MIKTSIRSGRKNLHFYLLASLFTALTAAGAFIRIPLPYVPITLQTFFVLLAGLILGPQFGFLSQIIYLTVGLIGLPVFANGGGIGYIFQPTFGYLLGYPVSAYVVGRLLWNHTIDFNASFVRFFVANLIGVLVIFVFGLTGLYINLRYVAGKALSLTTLMWTGFIVFIPGDLIKILTCSIIAKKLIPKIRFIYEQENG